MKSGYAKKLLIRIDYDCEDEENAIRVSFANNRIKSKTFCVAANLHREISYYDLIMFLSIVNFIYVNAKFYSKPSVFN